MPSNNDSKLQEQKELVIEGTILADGFRYRDSGLPVGDDSSEINTLKARVQALETLFATYFEYDSTTQVLTIKKEIGCSKVHLEGISKIVDSDGRSIIPDSVAGKYIVGGSDFIYHTTDLPTD